MKIKTLIFGKEEKIDIPKIIYDEFKKQEDNFEDWIYSNGFVLDLISISDGKIIDKDLAEFLIRYETESELHEGSIYSFNKQIEIKIDNAMFKVHTFGQYNPCDEGLNSIYLIGYKI